MEQAQKSRLLREHFDYDAKPSPAQPERGANVATS